MKNEIKGLISKGVFALKKRSPEILVAAGIVGVTAGAVLACKATLKAQDILAEAKDQLDIVHEAEQSEAHKDEYTAEDAKKDKAIVYIQTGVKLAKTYAPAAALGVAGITCILTSHGILRKRGAAMAAAYTALSETFKEYRKNVVDKIGEEAEKDLRYGLKAESVDGKEMSAEEAKAHLNDKFGRYSPYMKIFDETNDNFEKDSSYNLMFLKSQQAYANDLLNAKGYLFLNDVYDLLGFPRTKAGQVTGWLKNSKNGDGFVDFGIYQLDDEKHRDFINGYERSVILDFNVDGVIIDDFE